VSTTIHAVADIPPPAAPTNHQAHAAATRTSAHDISLRQAALVAGLALLVLAVLAPIANFGILHKLIVSGDAQTTAQNLAAAPGLFRIGIAFGADQLQAQMMVLLGAFQSAWELSLSVFGLHLFILGILVFGSGERLPRVLGILVIAAGVGYLVDGWGTLLVPNYSLGVGTYTFVGEALLIFWLLWKGIRGVDTSNHRHAEPAL
jgi:hypothetical protein